MKLKYLLLILCLAPFVLQAQHSFGVKAGYNHSTSRLSNSPYSITSYNPISRIHAGFFLHSKLANNIKLKSELLYTMKGSSSPTNTDTRYVFKINEISIPLIVSYQISKFSVGLGHEFGLKVNGRDLDKNIDLSFLGDLSIELSQSLSLGVRYNYGYTGLIDVTIIDINGEVSKGKYFTRTTQLGLAYKFGTL